MALIPEENECGSAMCIWNDLVPQWSQVGSPGDREGVEPCPVYLLVRSRFGSIKFVFRATQQVRDFLGVLMGYLAPDPGLNFFQQTFCASQNLSLMSLNIDF